jgi:hypothetical protein
MDSPIFGSQKSYQNSKTHKKSEFTTNYSDLGTSEWYVSNKSNSNSINSQISTDLKLAYTLLIVEKNIKNLFVKVYKW